MNDELANQVRQFIEGQIKFMSEMTARLSALQDYLAARDPKFWDDWPQFLDAAKAKSRSSFDS
jgi:hypothetical protein